MENIEFDDDLLFQFLQSSKNKVTVNQSMNNIPEVLYKYRKWNDPIHRKIIANREIYYARPNELDKFAEFTVSMETSPPPDNLLRAYYYLNALKDHPDWTENNRVDYVECWVTEFKERFCENPNFLSEINEEFDEKMFDSIGIFCTCAENYNIHLWNQFADGGRGFCVGFATKKLLENKQIFGTCGPVNYYSPDNKPIISNLSFSMEERLIKILLRINSIPIEYSDEKEYRISKSNCSERKIVLDPSYYKEIILGPCIDPNHEAEIREIAQCMLPNVPILRAKYNLQFNFIWIE